MRVEGSFDENESKTAILVKTPFSLKFTEETNNQK